MFFYSEPFKTPLSAELWANKECVSVFPVYGAGQDLELLIKDATCHLPWMAYTTGEPRLNGAVTGGHLTNETVT